MRDIILTICVIGSLPLILWRPYYGILVWSWLGYMNPHRLTWGFAYNLPFSQLVAISTLIGLLFYSHRGKIQLSPLMLVWVAFVFWVTLTTAFALSPSDAFFEWQRTIKIQLFVLLTYLLMQKKELIHSLIWVIVLSLGFFGVKGGVFSLLTGGNYLVWGPPGSFIEDNNALALALIMILPLMRYCQLTASDRYIKWALSGAMGLSLLAVLTSHSRGAMLGAIAMIAFLWWKGGSKLRTACVIIVFLPLTLFFMPDQWWERMESLKNYQEDASAMGRINAWWFAYNLAVDRPLLGGGFQTFTRSLFIKYAPDPEDIHDAHSIYFEMLAEHGFVGLILFLILGTLALRVAGKIVRQSKRTDGMEWMGHLAGMLQVSLVGYAVSGAFLGLAYFDLYYQLIAIILILRLLADQHMEHPLSVSVASVPMHEKLQQGSVHTLQADNSVDSSR